MATGVHPLDGTRFLRQERADEQIVNLVGVPP
jgi:hypothetical protein